MQKLENEARPKFTGSYKKKRVPCKSVTPLSRVCTGPGKALEFFLLSPGKFYRNLLKK